jgi:molecular chaperone HtpG
MNKEQRSFQAETKQLLDLMIHSIYTHREIFLRELISNASDAIDKARFKSLTDISLLEGDSEFGIEISFNKDKRTLSIKDNGIGMSYEEVVDHIGTIAKSGSKAFAQALKEKNESNSEIDIIGQFGVGFYSSFMVAKKVILITKAPLQDKGVQWESTGDGTYTIEYTDKAKRGTEIILELRDNEESIFYDEYIDSSKVETLIKKYSDYIRYPIRILDLDSADNGKSVNSMVPIWKKEQSKITNEEYNDFYKSKFHEWSDPLEVVHAHVDGSIEYDALIFIPSKAPFDFYSKDFSKGLQLYCKNVFIMDKCSEILPDYLGFVKGLVDSADFSLNISREILQQNRQLEIISKNIEKKVLSTLKDMQKNKRDKYEEFWKEFGVAVKNGIYSDFSGKNREKLEDLLLFNCSSSDKQITLAEYVEKMKEGQDKIYYVSGETRSFIEKLPQMETLKEKGYEVLYLFDRIDEFTLDRMESYKEKKFKSITRGELDLPENAELKKEVEEKTTENSSMLDKIKELLAEKVTSVKLTTRLKSTPACLVTDENGISLEMEKIISEMPNMGQMMKASKILELNPTHEVFEVLKSSYSKGNYDELSDFASLLYYQSALSEGIKIENPSDVATKINSLIVKMGSRI